ncbi:MAG: DUF5681 domain-containing protein [Sphingomonadaceae bacterium]
MSEDRQQGRQPPPVDHRIAKGEVRNPRGRPKGSLDRKRIVRKVALQKRRVSIDGRMRGATLLEIMLHKLKEMAARGHPGADKLLNEMRVSQIPGQGFQ